MAHRWNAKPARDTEHAVTCQLCRVVVERVSIGNGKFANFHTLPGQPRVKGLAPKCTGRETGTKPIQSAALLERPVVTPAKKIFNTDEEKIREVERLVYELMRELLPRDQYGPWGFKWDYPRGRYGQTNYGTRMISLSKPWALARPIEETKVTIVHEIAHARLPAGTGHGPAWVAEARRLGIKGERCSSSSAELPAKWVATCKNCGKENRKHRLTAQMRNGNHACKSCCIQYAGGCWDAAYVLTYVQQF